MLRAHSPPSGRPPDHETHALFPHRRADSHLQPGGGGRSTRSFRSACQPGPNGLNEYAGPNGSTVVFPFASQAIVQPAAYAGARQWENRVTLRVAKLLLQFEDQSKGELRRDFPFSSLQGLIHRSWGATELSSGRDFRRSARRFLDMLNADLLDQRKASPFRNDTTGQHVVEHAVLLGAGVALAGIVFAGVHFGAPAPLHWPSLSQVVFIAVVGLFLGMAAGKADTPENPKTKDSAEVVAFAKRYPNMQKVLGLEFIREYLEAFTNLASDDSLKTHDLVRLFNHSIPAFLQKSGRKAISIVLRHLQTPEAVQEWNDTVRMLNILPQAHSNGLKEPEVNLIPLATESFASISHQEKRIDIYDSLTGRLKYSIPLPPQWPVVSDITISPDTHFVAALSGPHVLTWIAQRDKLRAKEIFACRAGQGRRACPLLMMAARSVPGHKNLLGDSSHNLPSPH